jgi:hypothetical protein
VAKGSEMCEWIKDEYQLNCNVEEVPTNGGSGSGDSSGSSEGSEPAGEEVTAVAATAALREFNDENAITLKAAAGYSNLEASKKEAIDEAILEY